MMRTLVMWGLLGLGLAACGGADSVDRREELQALLDAGDHQEVLARVELYREQGESSPSLDYAQGLALLLGDDADKVAKGYLMDAVAADSSLAGPIADAYHAAAVEDHEEHWYKRAKFRMREAFRYNKDLPMEPVADPVADLLYREEKEYADAYLIYRKLVRKTEPRPSKKREWRFRYGHCLERMGFVEDAMTVYRGYREEWPDDMHFMRFVMWRYMQILHEWAKEAMEAGNLDTAMQHLDESFVEGWHIDLQQEGRYLAGQIEERRQDLAAAASWYRKVDEDGDQFGGEVVRLARTRLEELRNMGVH